MINTKTKTIPISWKFIIVLVLFIFIAHSIAIGAEKNLVGTGLQKLTPKAITSSDGKVKIDVISDLTIKEDCTVTITPYPSIVAIPALNLLVDYLPISGADLDVYDVSGNILTQEELENNIGGAFKPATTYFLGEIDGKQLFDSIENGKTELVLFCYKSGAWQKLGPAKIKPYTIYKKLFNDSGEFIGIEEMTKYDGIEPSSGVYMENYYSFVFAYKSLYGTQDISVKSGWNLKGLYLTPEDNSPASIFKDKNYTSLWKWDSNESTWCVDFPGQSEDFLNSYISDKGFLTIESLVAGEGFWINAPEEDILSVEGYLSTTTNPTLVAGKWNLLGSLHKDTVSASSLIDPLEVTSAWSWNADESKWRVYLPDVPEENFQTYVTSKGFQKLETINPGDGFWVNGQGYPPVVGQVYELNEQGALVPLRRVDILLDGSVIDTTDSLGHFSVADFLPNHIVSVKKDGFTPSSAKLNLSPVTLKVNPSVLVVQKLDTNETDLDDFYVNEVISSSDEKVTLQIDEASLTQSLSVVATPYHLPYSVPALEQIQTMGSGVEANVWCGADISLFDEQGNRISPEDAGFTGHITPVCKAPALSGYSVESLKMAVENDFARIWLLAYKQGKWQKLSENASLVDDGDGTCLLAPPEGVVMDGFYPFVYVLNFPAGFWKIKVTVKNGGVLIDNGSIIEDEADENGEVAEETLNEPVVGAIVTTDSPGSLAITDNTGSAIVIYQYPLVATTASVHVQKDGYYDATMAFNVLETEEIDLELVEKEKQAKINGMISDSLNQEKLEGATVVISTPTLLDQVCNNSGVTTVGLSNDATYHWELRKVKLDESSEEDWFTIKQEDGASGNTLSYQEIENLLISGFTALPDSIKSQVGDFPAGDYELRLTATHYCGIKGYIEKATGFLTIGVNLNKLQLDTNIKDTQWGEISIVGGKEICFYGAKASMNFNNTWSSSIFYFNDKDSDLMVDEGELDTLAGIEPVPSSSFNFNEVLNLINKNYGKLLQPSPDAGKTYLQKGCDVVVQLDAQYTEGGYGSFIEKSGYSKFLLQAEDPATILKVERMFLYPNSDVYGQYKTVTDNNGNFQFENLDPDLSGLLKLTISKDGYITKNISLSGGQYTLSPDAVLVIDEDLNKI